MKLVDDDFASIGMFGSNESFGVIETESFLYEENSPYIPGGSYSVSWSGAFLKDQPYEGDNPYIPNPGEPGYPEPGDDDAWFARFKALMRKAEREPVDKEAEAWFAQLNGEKYPLDDDYTQEQHEAFMAKFDNEQPEHQDRADGIMPLRYDEDYFAGRESNPGGGSSGNENNGGGGSSDNEDNGGGGSSDNDGGGDSGGGGYSGGTPGPIYYPGLYPGYGEDFPPGFRDPPGSDSAGSPPNGNENNGGGGSSDNDGDRGDDAQNRQDQSPNDDNEDSDGSPSNDNRNAGWLRRGWNKFRNWFTTPNRGPEIKHPPSHNEESTVATSNTQDIFTAEAESDKGNDWLEAARELKRLEASIKPFPVDEVTGDPYFDYFNEPFTSSDGLKHYKQGTGIAVQINFDQVDTSSVSPFDFPEVIDAIKAGVPGTKRINSSMSFNTGTLLLGNITLRLQGTLSIGEEEDDDSFSGILKSLDDVYDFNASNHRGLFAEVLTKVGSIIKGRTYPIQIRGSKWIEE